MKKVFYFTAFTLCIVAGVTLTSFNEPTRNHVITEMDGDVVIEWYSETETATPFEEGWETGHCEGWKDVKGQNVWCPTAPWAPTPDWDCGDSYRCGYNRGFKFARCKAQGYTNCKK
mgnify:CR=1 FL=1